MNKSKTCPICHKENTVEAQICINCGQRLEVRIIEQEKEDNYAGNKDGLEMFCPICHKTNKLNAEQCSSCGQRLRTKKLKKKEYKNYFNRQNSGTKSKKSRNGSAFFILMLSMILIISFNQQEIALISKVIPGKIVSINDMTIYINQNDKFELPTKIGAKMNYGGSKAVVVSWDTNKVDSSTAGIKLINGKINGYDKVVCFKITVLANQVQESIGNCTVENSMVELNIKLSKTIKWVWFKVCKGSAVEDETVPVNDGVLNCKVYLPLGSGDYQVKILTSTLDSEDGTYSELRDINVKNQDARDMSFLMPEINVQSDSDEIRNLAYKITEGCYSDMEKTKAIHDWVASNISYDTEAYFSNNTHEYSAIETFEGEKAVCNGYANLTAALNRAIGIRCKIVGGTARNSIFDIISKDNSHAWNETYIDRKWIIQDTTWDAGVVNGITKKFKFQLSHKYFNPSSTVFRKDHKKTSEE